MPLGVDSNPGTEALYGALHEGVPSWLRQSLMDWVEGILHQSSGFGESYWDRDFLLQLERKLRLHFSSQYDRDTGHAFMELIEQDEDVCLKVVDYILAFAGLSERPVIDVGLMLHDAGSAWTLGQRAGRRALVRRVDETVTAAAEREMARAGRPSTHLRNAWEAAYGREPRPSEAYREAVRAVEAAAKPVISPNNPKATLGTMIADIKNKPEKWTVGLPNPDGSDQVSVVRSMCELLWKGQIDRHGTDDESSAVTVDAAEAEAALHIATTLVHWFTTGAIRPTL